MLSNLIRFSNRLPRICGPLFQRNYCRDLSGEPIANNPVAKVTRNDEELKLLSFLNNSNEFEQLRDVLTENRFNKIKKWQSDNGNFKSFEEILKLKGFTAKVVEKLQAHCKARVNTESVKPNIQPIESPPLLKEYSVGYVDENQRFILYEESNSVSSPNIDSNMYTNADFAVKSTILHQDRLTKNSKPIKISLEPKLTQFKAKTIETFVSIHQDSRSITWTRFSATESGWSKGVSITHWKYNSLATGNVANLHILQLSRKLSEIIADIPNSDAYIIETQPKTQYRNNMTAKQIAEIIQINQTTSILITQLLNRDDALGAGDSNEPKVYFMGNTLMGRLYKLYIGHETVSTQTIIKNLLNSSNRLDSEANNNEAIENEQFDVSFGNNLKKIYSLSSNVEKEFLGKSMLIGLTFFRLALLQMQQQ